MHLVLLQAMLPEPFKIVPLLVYDADPMSVADALGRVWGGPETVIAVSSGLSHFLDQRSARAIDSSTARLIGRWTLRRSMGAAPAASWRSRPCSPSPPSATCGRPVSLWRPQRTPARVFSGGRLWRVRPRIRGLGAPADAIASALLAASMAALGVAARNGDKAPARGLWGRRIARAFFVARDFRHLDRERAAGRLHRARSAPIGC